MRAHSRCDAARSATATNVGSANCRMPKCKYGYLVEMTHCRTKKGPPLSKFHQKDWWEQNVLFFFLQRSCHRLIPRFCFPFFFYRRTRKFTRSPSCRAGVPYMCRGCPHVFSRAVCPATCPPPALHILIYKMVYTGPWNNVFPAMHLRLKAKPGFRRLLLACSL